MRRLAAALAALTLLLTAPRGARAADPYEIAVVLDLTGYASFVGTSQLQAVKALEAYVNKTGGINGRPVSFVVSDDASDPKNTVQIVQGLIAKHVPVILGPSGPDKCAAATPLVAQDGPVLFCTTPNAPAAAGGYVFLALYNADANLAVTVRYLRERGWRRIAYLGTNDATGQDAERALNDALALPENAGVTIVSRQHFAPSDISVAAQVSAIKAAAPDALIGWAAGTPAGIMFHGLHDGGLDIPTVTSQANLNVPFFKQFGSIAPANLYFSGAPINVANTITNAALKKALGDLTASFVAIGTKPELIQIAAWDPGLLVVDALRKLGTDATPAKLRAYLLSLKGWTGAMGAYDFPANPQHGVGQNAVVMIRYNPTLGSTQAVSAFGGAPLPGR